jgi:hypothetical protein
MSYTYLYRIEVEAWRNGTVVKLKLIQVRICERMNLLASHPYILYIYKQGILINTHRIYIYIQTHA